MPSGKRTAALLVVRVLSVAGVAETPGVAVGEESLLAAAPQDPAAGEGLAGTPTAHPATGSAGTPQRGFRPRHTGRSVRPADARRDSGNGSSRGVRHRRGT